VADLRRQFRLPGADEEYLDSLSLPWETITQTNQQWLLIHNWKVVEGYNHQIVGIALLIDPNYPDTQLDSFWVCPVLQRRDGGVIKQSAHRQPIDGNQFQFWSRHRTPTNPWRPGIDEVSTHLALVQEWFKRSLSD